MTDALLTIALLHWAVLLVPGFNFVLISRLAAGGSRSAAMAAVAGMTTTTLLWALLAVAGVGLVFSAHPLLRQLVQLVGGLYLLLLAARFWRSGAAGDDAGAARAMSRSAAFRAGFATSALNPKIALFYGSVFATAMPARPPLALVAAAVAMVWLNSIVWHTALALALSRPAVRRGWLRHGRALNRLCGALVGAFGARLLLQAADEWRQRVA